MPDENLLHTLQTRDCITKFKNRSFWLVQTEKTVEFGKHLGTKKNCFHFGIIPTSQKELS